jgi:hypothetical protein
MYMHCLMVNSIRKQRIQSTAISIQCCCTFIEVHRLISGRRLIAFVTSLWVATVWNVAIDFVCMRKVLDLLDSEVGISEAYAPKSDSYQDHQRR